MIIFLVTCYKMTLTRLQSSERRKSHLNLRNPLWLTWQQRRKARKMMIRAIGREREAICSSKLHSLSTLKSILWPHQEVRMKAELLREGLPSSKFNTMNKSRWPLGKISKWKNRMVSKWKKRMISWQWWLELALHHFRSPCRKTSRIFPRHQRK
jgi:hypothetical protein